MVRSSLFAVAIAALSAQVSAAPIQKRIAQTITDSTAKWVAACQQAGGGTQCQPISQTAFTSLLAAGKACDQQDAADSMIDLAKTLNNDATMISLAQIFAQQPRNSPNSVSVPYCQKAPKNSELNGLFQCQFQGDNPTTFAPAVPGDTASGNIPFGMTSALSPAGSCPANPSGPIADGTQLVDLTTNPGVSSSGGAASSGSSSASSGASASVASGDVSSAAGSDTDSGSDDAGVATVFTTVTATAASTTATTAASASSDTTGSSNGSSFLLSNGQKAQQQNAQFAQLSTSSTCTDGENACVNGGFAQCVSGSFVVTQCAASEQCFSLPLVNSAGTSITCTTQSDAQSRIQATGATGGVDGSSS